MHLKKKRTIWRTVLIALMLLATINALQTVCASKPPLSVETTNYEKTPVESTTLVTSSTPLIVPIEIDSQFQTPNSKSSWNEETAHVWMVIVAIILAAVLAFLLNIERREKNERLVNITKRSTASNTK